MDNTLMLDRSKHQQRVQSLLRQFPVVAILGARQVGKTTLARQIADGAGEVSHWFDLEDLRDAQRLSDPFLALEGLSGLIVIDEVQRVPGLFQTLRVLADRPDNMTRFLILGSASGDLLRQTSESLAGRIALHTLPGFSLTEVGIDAHEALWLRGGFPLSFLAADEAASFEWRRQFLRSFLERDIPQLGSRVPAATLGRFWGMLAHWHGQIWKASEFARNFGVSDMTVRRYLDLLTDALVIVQLSPWHENLSKRQVKSPKIYLADSGMLHTLLGVCEQRGLERHPKVGASWEGFALQQVVHRLGVHDNECFFWATHQGAELDLLVQRGQLRLGFEFKRTSTPRPRKSMRVAVEDLSLDELVVIYPGSSSFALAERIRAVGMTRILRDVEPLD